MDEATLRTLIREEIKVLVPENEKFISAEAAAAYLSCSIHTIYRMTSKRLLNHYKSEGTLLFKESELLQHVESGKQSKSKI